MNVAPPSGERVGQLQSAALRLGERPGDEQPEARARSGGARGQPREAAEEQLALLVRHTGSAIGHLDGHAPVATPKANLHRRVGR